MLRDCIITGGVDADAPISCAWEMFPMAAVTSLEIFDDLVGVVDGTDVVEAVEAVEAVESALELLSHEIVASSELESVVIRLC